MMQTLTVGEKILYHLCQYIKSEDRYEVPFDITQDGIAQACGISRAHAAIELKKLKEAEQIIEKLSHVRRAKSRRKVYFLSPDGKIKAEKIVEHVRVEKLDPGVDISRITQGCGPAKRLKRYTSAIPQPKQFFGREKELSALRSDADDDSIDIISLIGLSGIGKTTLLAKFAKESKSSVFWFSLSEWETELSLLKALAIFLEEICDGRLMNYLKSDRIDFAEVSYLLAEALTENRRILVFDDVDKAPRLDTIFKMIIQNSGPNKIIISSEAQLPILDEMKAAGKTIKEIIVEGLDRSAAEELLRSRGIDDKRIDALCELTGRHPMLLDIIPSDDEFSAKMEMSNFVKKTLLKGIPPQDMTIIEKCSILRKPFSAEFLPRFERHILHLPIFNSTSGRYSMHEMVRRIVHEQIAMSDLSELHSKAADFYLNEKNLPERLYHLVIAGRYLEAEMLIHTHSDELLASESPKNLLSEISLMPARMSKYTSSVRIMAARASSLLGDEGTAIDELKKIADNDTGDKRAAALMELSRKSLDRKSRKKIFSQLSGMLSKGFNSEGHRANVAMTLATMKLADGELEDCERLVNIGLSSAAASFSLDTISSLNRILGQVLVSSEKYAEAINFLSKTAPSFVGRNRPFYHRLMAKAMLKTGREDEAMHNLESGIAVAEQNGLFKELAESLLDLCNVKILAKDLSGAAESCYRCIEVSSSINENGTLAQAYSNLAKIESERGNAKEAKENEGIAKKIAIENEIPSFSILDD